MNNQLNVCENTNQITVSIIFLIMMFLGYVTMSFVNKSVESANSNNSIKREYNSDFYTQEADFFIN